MYVYVFLCLNNKLYSKYCGFILDSFQPNVCVCVNSHWYAWEHIQLLWNALHPKAFKWYFYGLLPLLICVCVTSHYSTIIHWPLCIYIIVFFMAIIWYYLIHLCLWLFFVSFHFDICRLIISFSFNCFRWIKFVRCKIWRERKRSKKKFFKIKKKQQRKTYVWHVYV